MRKKIRDTSRIMYKELIDSGVLGVLQERVLGNFKMNENSTDKEISRFSSLDINIVTARRNELMKMGVIGTKEKRACKVTGKLAHIWYTRKSFVYHKPKKVEFIMCQACGGTGRFER